MAGDQTIISCCVKYTSSVIIYKDSKNILTYKLPFFSLSICIYLVVSQKLLKFVTNITR